MVATAEPQVMQCMEVWGGNQAVDSGVVMAGLDAWVYCKPYRDAEGGGGLNSGPFGVELSLKFALNRLEQPVEHRFLTIPISLRGTVSF